MALQTARESMVLLKNDNNTLPISSAKVRRFSVWLFCCIVLRLVVFCVFCGCLDSNYRGGGTSRRRTPSHAGLVPLR